MWSRAAGVGQVAVCDASGTPPAPKLWLGPPFSPSDPRGVDQVVASRARQAFPALAVGVCPAPRIVTSWAWGVVHIACASFSAFGLKSEFPAALFPFCAGVPAIGVGHDEHPLAFMRRARFCRCKQASRRRVTHSP